MKFDGTLTEQEQERLKNLSILEMKLIKYYLKKYQNELTGFRDLVGDIEVPSNLFYLNMFLFGHLLENNNMLLKKSRQEENLEITIPKEPVIWTLNHYFNQDIIATMMIANRPTYLVAGALPQLYNTLTGLAMYISGIIVVNRKVPSSKQAVFQKMENTIYKGMDVMSRSGLEQNPKCANAPFMAWNLSNCKQNRK